MASFAPFPKRPEIALALSGGADSMALLVLLRAWTAARAGRLIAFVVDHGLRGESAAEARRVAARAEALGVESHVLTWRGAKPSSALQATARAARYRLLEAACRERGLLYLAAGHHGDDQVETFLLRLESGSGPTGLAAMSALSVRRHLLLLRPLLGFPKARLEALLRAEAVPWVEDPSNRDPRHRRVVMRALRTSLARHQDAPGGFCQAQGLFARLRRSLERDVLAWLAAACHWYPQGYASLDRVLLERNSASLVGPALALVLRTIGGAVYGPAPDRVVRLLADLMARQGSTTLSGCRLMLEEEALLVVRESRAPRDLALKAGLRQHWDRRFRLQCDDSLAEGLCIRSLTEAGWQRMEPRPGRKGLPAAALWSLPSVWDEAGPLRVPHLAWQRPEGPNAALSLRFHPLSRPGSAVFAVA